MVGKKRTAAPQSQLMEGEAGATRANRRRSARGQKAGESILQHVDTSSTAITSMAEQTQFSNCLVPVMSTTTETNLSYPGGESYHFVVDAPGTDVMDYFGSDDANLYQNYSYENENEAGACDTGDTSSIGAGSVPMVLASSSGLRLPAEHLVATTCGDKHRKCPTSKLLYGKYAFPKQMQPYDHGTRTYVSLTAQELAEIVGIGRRNFGAWRALIGEGNAVSMVEEFMRLEKKRRIYILQLAKMIHSSRKIRTLVEEENARVKGKMTDLQEKVRSLTAALIKLHDDNAQLRVNIMADKKTAEQAMFHEKKYNEVVEELKSDYARKSKEDQTKLKRLKDELDLMRRKYRRTRKELAKYKQNVQVEVPVKQPLLGKSGESGIGLVQETSTESFVKEVESNQKKASAVTLNHARLAVIKEDLDLSDGDISDSDVEADTNSLNVKRVECKKSNSQASVAHINEPEVFQTVGDLFAENLSRLSDSDDDEIEAAHQQKKRSATRHKPSFAILGNLDLSDNDEFVADKQMPAPKKMKTKQTDVQVDPISSKQVTGSEGDSGYKKKVGRNQSKNPKKSRKRSKKGPGGMTKKQLAELEEYAVKGEEFNEHTKRRRATKRETLQVSPKTETENNTRDETVEAENPKPAVQEIHLLPELPLPQAKGSGRTSRRKQVIEKIGDVTTPQPVVASCEKVKLNRQIERARQNKRPRGNDSPADEQPNPKKPVLDKAYQNSVVEQLNPRKARAVAGPSRLSGVVPIIPIPRTFDSPRSPPMQLMSQRFSNTESPENIKAAAGVLRKHLLGKSLEDLQKNSMMTSRALADEINFPPEVLARAIFNIILSDKGKKRGKMADTFVECLDEFVQIVEKSKLEFEQFSDVMLRDFENSISKRNANYSNDFAYKRLGKFYGVLLRKCSQKHGVGSQNERALDIILNCMYWQSEHALGFLHQLLLQHSDPLSLDKNIYNSQNSGVAFTVILYVMHRGKKCHPSTMKPLRNLGIQSLRHQDMFKDVDHAEFVEGVIRKLKGAESDNLIRTAAKSFGVLCVHFGDWTWFVGFVKTQLENMWKECNENALSWATLAAFVQTIGDVVQDMKHVDDITELKQAVVRAGSKDKEVTAAVTKCLEKLEARQNKKTGQKPDELGAARPRGRRPGTGKKNWLPPPQPQGIGLQVHNMQRKNRGQRTIPSF